MTADPFTVPYLPVGGDVADAEVEAVTRVLRSGQGLSCGPERDAFEREFAEYAGVPYALSVTNCTVALEFATYLLGLRGGDEVIAATQTYQATVTPLLALPVTVRFCDVDANTLNISPAAFESLITERTRALYLVHYGGYPADMRQIMKIAAEHGIAVVEDCAHALGAQYHGQVPGSFGDFGCWSFQSYKNITTLGEGGMLTCKDPHRAHVVSRIRAIEPDADFVTRSDQSLDGMPAPQDDVERHAKNAYLDQCIDLRHPGTNSTLCEPAAAAGRVQLLRLAEFVSRRRQIADRLDAGLAEIGGITTQARTPGVRSAHHLYTCFLDPATGIARDSLAQRLYACGIQVQLRYFPVNLLPEWRLRGHGLGECPTAERIWFHEHINLPIYPQLADWQVDFMIEQMGSAMRELGA